RQASRELALQLGCHHFHERKPNGPAMYVYEHQMGTGSQVAEVAVSIELTGGEPVLVARRDQFDGGDELPLTIYLNGRVRLRVQQGNGLEVRLNPFNHCT